MASIDRRAPAAAGADLDAIRAALRFRPNADRARRDELLGFDDCTPARGAAEAFCELGGTALRALIDEGFVDPTRRHHDSPSALDFAAFVTRWPQVVAHGYIDEPETDDARIVIEGLECDLDRVTAPVREILRDEFNWFCGDAAEYFDEADYLYAWWG